MKTKRDVLDFLIQCITTNEADAYQQFENEHGDIPDSATPDSWDHDDKSEIRIRKGDRVFLVKVSIPRTEGK
jgi:hypothetical protein